MHERREARQFEPPPWEQELYAEQERKRQAEQERNAEAATATTPPAVSTEPGAQTMGEAVAEAAIAQSRVAPAAEVSGGEPAADDKAQAAALEAMLAQLSAEEPKADKHFGNATMAFAAVLAATGLVLMVWGGVAAVIVGRKGGSVGAAGGIALTSLGSLFVGAGVWVIVSNLRKRGVF